MSSVDMSGVSKEILAQTPIASLLGKTRVEQEEEVADALRMIADARRAVGRPFALDEVLDALPWVAESDLALDAAIDEALGPTGETTLEAAAEAMMTAFPHLAVKIQRAALLRVALETTSTGRSTTASFTLPCRIGPPDYTGEPRYELRSRLGAGAQGTVYVAVDRVFSEPEKPVLVAVKVAHAPGRERDPWRDSQEAKRARRVEHEAVVRALDIGALDDGRSFAVYELIDGVPLDTWVKARSSLISPREVARIVERVARGVQAAHAVGLSHGDIKPSNIIVDTRQQPKVADFGIAAEFELPFDTASAFSTRGSLAFMAPEQFRMEAHGRSPAADVYALGGLLFWLLTGNLPNGSTALEAVSWLEDEGTSTAARFAENFPANVPQTLQAICLRALDRAAPNRHPSAQALADDLHAYLSHEPIAWRKPGTFTRTRLLLRRRPWLSAATAVGLVGLLSGVSLVVNAYGELRLERARNAQALRDEQMRSTIALLEERAASQDEKIARARKMVDAWAGVLRSSPNFSPPQYLAVLSLLHSSEVFADTSSTDDFLLDSIGTGLNVIAQAEASGDGETLETALWHDLLAGWRAERGEFDAAARHAERAHAIISAMRPNDPWSQRLELDLARLRATPPAAN